MFETHAISNLKGSRTPIQVLMGTSLDFTSMPLTGFPQFIRDNGRIKRIRHSAACLRESNRFIQYLYFSDTRPVAGKWWKKCADFSEVAPKKGAIEQFSKKKTKDFHGLYILPQLLVRSSTLSKVDKTRIWDKLGFIWLFNSNEPQISKIKTMETRWDNYTAN